MSVAAPPVPASPFKGLAPYDDSELDAIFFFGREREREIVTANLVATRVTVLHGRSGVGKSSLLRAGVAWHLREQAGRAQQARGRPELAVAVVSGWSGDAVAAVVEAAAEAVAEATGEAVPPPDPALSLADALARLADRVAGHLYVVLDQFEEYFLYGGADGRDRFGREFPDAVADPALRANFLLALREDALAELDLFQGRIPRLLGNVLRLEHLDRDAARAAIVGPVARFNELVGADARVTVEPELVEAVLDEVAEGEVELVPGGAEEPQRPGRRVEAPFLQLVLQRLWEAEREAGSRTLRLETLRSLGGAAAIVRDHLERALAALDRAEKDVAARIFAHLVTPSGTKIAQKVDDLAQYAGVGAAEVAPVLAALDRERIVRPVEHDGGDRDRYEIFHDVLADAVLAWRARRELEREREAAARRHRRLLAVIGGILAVLALVAALAVWALVERGGAEASARSARAREEAAVALAQLPVDPQHSLVHALTAARLEATPTTEDVLRRALLTSRLRRVLPVGRRVTVATFGPSAARVLAGDQNGRVRILDTRSGRVLHVFHHGGPVTAASFDRAGELVLTASTDGAARLFDARSGRLLRLLRHPAPVASAEFARVGRVFLTASADGQVRIYPVAGGAPVRVFRVPGQLRAATLAPDGRRAVAIVRESSGAVRAHLFDVPGARELAVLPVAGATVARFAPDGTLLAVGSAGGGLGLWRSADGSLERRLRGHDTAVFDVVFGPHGHLLASASADGGTGVWDVRTGQRTLLLVGHTNYVTAVAFSPSGRVVASASRDRTVLLWNSRDGDDVGTLAGHSGAVTTVAFSRQGGRILTGSTDGTVRIWDGSEAQGLRPLHRFPAGATSAVFAARGAFVVAGGADGRSGGWSVRRRRALQVYRDAAPVTAVAASADGSVIASGGADGTIQIRGLRSDRLLGTVRLPVAVETLAFAPSGSRLLATAGQEARLLSLRGRTLRRLHLSAPVTDAVFAPDGALVAVAEQDGRVALWPVAGGRPRRVLRARGSVTRVRFSPDGTLVATAGSDGLARLWGVETGRLARVLRGHAAAVTDVAFSADGARAVTASVDHDARTWDVATGKPLRVLRGHFGAVTGASFSPDGRWVATAGPATIGLWDADAGRLLFYVRGPKRPPVTAEFSQDGDRILGTSADGLVGIYDCLVCGGATELVRRAERRLEDAARRPRAGP